MAQISITVGTLSVLLVLAFARLLSIGRRPKGYPPGPPTLPIIGNIHQMPTRDPHLQFQKWAEQYGDVYSLILGTKTMIVLSSDEAIKDLLDRRSAIYSGRQEMYIGQNVCSGGLRMLMMDYGPTWRMVRKMVHNLLNQHVAQEYGPYQDLENKQMLYDLLFTPDSFLKHIRRYSNALTTSMVFGWRSSTHDDPAIRQFFDGFAEFAEMNGTGAAALIDFYPLLRRLPDSILTTRRKAKQLHKAEKELYLRHWLRAKEERKAGTITQCFCVGLAEVQEKEGFDDAQAAYISGTLLEAGSDTTSSTLYAFVQAMLLYPEVQRRAQEQVDSVCGANHMPTLDDASRLPYIRSVMKETLRWMPTTILGAVPHAASTDDTYKGYIIPKGAGIVNNVWTINMDPRRAQIPRTFNPDRYADDFLSLFDSASNPDGHKRDHFTFGAGRRICPGIHVAERSLFLGMSRLLWAFDILPTTGTDGNKVLPDQESLTQGFVVMPQTFAANILPRSKAKADLIQTEWKKAERELLDPLTKQWLSNPVKE